MASRYSDLIEAKIDFNGARKGPDWNCDIDYSLGLSIM
jgi:hypothetical protein